MIRAEGLGKVFRSGEVETIALDGVDLSVEEGEFVAVMGPSGCGKSTLLNLLGLLDSPTSGRYLFLGEEVSNWGERRRAALRKRSVGFVFQSFNLIDELTAWENVELPLLYLGVGRGERRRRVEEVMGRLGILPRRDRFPQQLSGGQQQRTALARAVVARPRLVLADEPTGNLDSAHGDEVMRLLAGLNEDGTTVVMVTHSPTYAEYARRIVHLVDGAVVAEDIAGKPFARG